MGEAYTGAKEAFTGKAPLERPDVGRLSTAGYGEGAGKPISEFNKMFQFIPRALEAGDVLFRTMIKGGEAEAIAESLRKSGKDIDVDQVAREAADRAEYFVFRQRPDGSDASGQGPVLKTIDKMTSQIYGLRNKVPGVKWFVPFVQTPMNILKQGIEYSPAGLATVKGAANQQEQIAKALMGSTVFAGAATLVASGNATWAAPTGEKEKKLFYASGKKPYSIRIGDNWYSYSKLGPLAYPIAMSSAIQYHFKENPKAFTDDTYKKVMDTVVSIAGFFADQSYMQGIGDLIDTVNGAPGAAERAVANMPRQVLPLSSFQGWVARMIDPIYRNPDSPIESIMTGIPGLSTQVEPHTDPTGAPSERKNVLFNSLSPIDKSPVNKEFEQQLLRYQHEKTLDRINRELKAGNITAEEAAIARRKLGAAPSGGGGSSAAFTLTGGGNPGANLEQLLSTSGGTGRRKKVSTAKKKTPALRIKSAPQSSVPVYSAIKPARATTRGTYATIKPPKPFMLELREKSDQRINGAS